MMNKCPKCGLEYNEGQTECLKCGIIFEKYEAFEKKDSFNKDQSPKREPPVIVCKSCHKEISETMPFCPHCGASIKDENREKPTKLKKCRDCGNEVSTLAESCPKCGAVLKKKTGCFGYVGGAFLIIVFIVAIVSVFSDHSKKPTSSSTSKQTIAPSETEKMKAAEKAKRRAEYKKRKQEEYEQCKTDLQCWGDKHSFRAIVACQNLIEKHAEYSFKWTDGWLGSKLTRFRWKDKDKLTLTYFGDKIQFQNGFSAWQNMIYQCDYDPINKKVLSVKVQPGRF